MSMVMREVNDLGSTLQRQRTEAVESTALLTHVMEEIDVAVFAFDPDEQLLLVNKAAERLLGKPRRGAGRAAGVRARLRRVPDAASRAALIDRRVRRTPRPATKSGARRSIATAGRISSSSSPT